ncbi:hypothetical protein CRG98_022218, partial [Punica granatum]
GYRVTEYLVRAKGFCLRDTIPQKKAPRLCDGIKRSYHEKCERNDCLWHLRNRSKPEHSLTIENAAAASANWTKPLRRFRNPRFPGRPTNLSRPVSSRLYWILLPYFRCRCRPNSTSDGSFHHFPTGLKVTKPYQTSETVIRPRLVRPRTHRSDLLSHLGFTRPMSGFAATVKSGSGKSKSVPILVQTVSHGSTVRRVERMRLLQGLEDSARRSKGVVEQSPQGVSEGKRVRGSIDGALHSDDRRPPFSKNNYWGDDGVPPLELREPPIFYRNWKTPNSDQWVLSPATLNLDFGDGG